jgi:hypothetical protein
MALLQARANQAPAFELAVRSRSGEFAVLLGWVMTT